MPTTATATLIGEGNIGEGLHVRQLALALRIDQGEAVERVRAVARERRADLDRVVRAVAGRRDGRVEHDRRAAALELGDDEDEVAAVGSSSPPPQPATSSNAPASAGSRPI